MEGAPEHPKRQASDARNHSVFGRYYRNTQNSEDIEMSETTEGQQELAHDKTDGKHKKKTLIIINATQFEVDDKDLTYEQILNLFYNNAPPTGENVAFTMTYTRGENGKEGTMLPGDSVKVKPKMVFDVTPTDRS